MSFNAGSAYLELEGKDKGVLTLLGNIEGKLGSLSLGFGKLNAILVGIGSLTVFKDMSQKAIEFESAFIGIKKTVDATAKEYDKLEKSIFNMTKRIPKSAADLAKIGEIGGQLGVKVPQMEKFIDTVAKISDTTNLTQEQAATDFARIATITKEPIENIDRMASATVSLGNNFATTESEIVGFTNRIAASGDIAGLSTPELFGVSAAFTSVGIQAEAGGTSVNLAFGKITDAIRDGGPKLELLAKVSGKTVDQFKQDWKESAGKTFATFIKGLGEQGQNGSKILGQLFGTSSELNRAFLSVANAGDLMVQTVDKATTGYAENNALTKEAEQRYGSMASRIQIMKNVYDEFAITIGTVMNEFLVPFGETIMGLASIVMPILIGAFKLVFGTLGEILSLFTHFSAQSDIMKAVIVGISTAIIGAMIPSLITLATTIYASIIPAITGIITSIKALTIAMLSNPLTLIITGIAIAVGALYYAWTKNFGGIKDFSIKIFGQIKEGFEYLKAAFFFIIDQIKSFFSSNLSAIFENFKSMFSGIVQYFKGVIQIFQGDFKNGFDNILSGAGTFLKNLFSFFLNTFTMLGKIVYTFVSISGKAWLHFANIVASLLTDIFNNWKTILSNVLIMIGIFVKNAYEYFVGIDWGAGWNKLISLGSQALKNILNKIKDWGKSVVNYIKKIFTGEDASIDVGTNIDKVGEGEKKTFLQDLSDGINKVDFSNTKKAVGSLTTDIKGAFAGITLQPFKKEVDSTTDAVQKLGGEIVDTTNVIDDLGGGGGKGGKALDKIEEEKKAKLKALDEEYSEKIRLVNLSSDTEINKAREVQRLSEELQKKKDEINKTFSENEKNNAAEVIKKWEEKKKTVVATYEEVGKKITDSLGRIQKYGEKLKELKDKFSELKKSAKSDIDELNNSISQLDVKLSEITTAGEKERSGIQTNAEIALAERRLAILERQKEIEKEVSSINSKEKDSSDYEKLSELDKERLALQNELSIISGKVSEEISKQVEEASKRNEAEKILFQLNKDIADQKAKEKEETDKIQKEKDLLIEKKAISEAILADRNLKIVQEGELLKAFYTDASGKEVEIKDFKNIQYAQDLENKRLAIQSQILAVEEGMLKEKELLAGFLEEKTNLEKLNTEMLKEEKAKQRAEIEKEIAQTKDAIRMWNEYWKAKRSGNGNVSVNNSGNFAGYKTGGYTGNIGVNEVAGVVHGGEYVIPNNVMKKLGGTGVLEGLEKLRRGFSNGGFTSSVPNVSNISSPSLNVTQNIASGIDISAAIREMTYLLRLS